MQEYVVSYGGDNMPLFRQENILSTPSIDGFEIKNIFLQDNKLIIEFEDNEMAIRSIEIDPDTFSTGEEVRDALLELSDVDRQIIITRPDSGELPIIAMNGTPKGSGPPFAKAKLEIEFDDTPVV